VALREAKDLGWGIIVKEAIANGRLTDQANGERLTELRSVADAHGTTIDAVALAAVLSQPWADVVLSGAVTTDQLDSNVNAVALARLPIEWPDITESPTAYWTQRSALAWQ
jgi:aryl-alcohol dehydrogenase-like predicted oxidoreductase